MKSEKTKQNQILSRKPIKFLKGQEKLNNILKEYRNDQYGSEEKRSGKKINRQQQAK